MMAQEQLNVFTLMASENNVLNNLEFMDVLEKFV